MHRAGHIIRELRGMEEGSTYSKRWMLALASHINRGWEQEDRSLQGFLYRAREFAKWPEDEVARFAEAKRRTGRGTWENFSWEYAWRMLSVREPKKRAALVERWTKQQFSLRAWDGEIQELHGIRYLGRPPDRPKSIVAALRQTEREARHWKMWFENNLASARPATSQEEGRVAPLEEFPVGLSRLLKQAMPIIERIQEKARLAWLRATKGQVEDRASPKSEKRRRAGSRKT